MLDGTEICGNTIGRSPSIVQLEALPVHIPIELEIYYGQGKYVEKVNYRLILQ